jgi:hypothetical protein
MLGIPARSHADWWQVGELYANYVNLENNLVPGKAGNLPFFSVIQWEHELYNDQPKEGCYPFDLPKHVWVKPTQVDADFMCYVLYDIGCDILPQYHDRTVFAKLPPSPTIPPHQKPLMLPQTLI